VRNDAEDRLDVALTTCERTNDGWRASGTVMNSSDSDATYEITIFFTTDAGTVIAFDSVRTPVSAGTDAAWEVEGEFAAPQPTLCVLRGAARV
jgi:hypothetical protein